MKTTEFFDKVQELNLGDKYDMNAGGCGWFALMMLELMPHLDVMYLIDWEGHKDKVEDDVPTACAHVVLTDHEHVYDSNGVEPMRKTRRYNYAMKVSKDYLEKSCKEATNWNSCFDKKKLPEVEREVSAIFKQLKSHEDAKRKQTTIDFKF